MDNERDSHYFDASTIHSITSSVCSFLIILAEHHQQINHVPLLSMLHLPVTCIPDDTAIFGS